MEVKITVETAAQQTERESVLEISVGDQRRIKKTAHSQCWVKDSDFSQFQK